MNNVRFGRNGRNAERCRLTSAATAMKDEAIPGQSDIYECLFLYCTVFNYYSKQNKLSSVTT